MTKRGSNGGFPPDNAVELGADGRLHLHDTSDSTADRLKDLTPVRDEREPRPSLWSVRGPGPRGAWFGQGPKEPEGRS